LAEQGAGWANPVFLRGRIGQDHYAPRISGAFLLVSLFCILTRSSDLKDVDNMSFDFPLGTLFCPYEQIMGVLPLASKDQILGAYHVRNFRACFNQPFDILL